MKIVILDGSAANPGDINWNPLANIGEVITYYVREVSTEAPHVNILDGKYIKFNVTITNDEKVFIPDSSFKVCNESDDQEVTDRSIYDQISYKISSVGTENIQIYIENPVEYNFELTKYDTAGNEINCARLEVQKGEEIYNNNGESKVSINERNVKLGDYNSYIIREKDVELAIKPNNWDELLGLAEKVGHFFDSWDKIIDNFGGTYNWEKNEKK